MNVTLIGFISMCFVGLTLINRVIEGAMISAGDIATISKMTITYNAQIGPLNIPVPNIGFFTEGIPALIRWDYTFFGGNAAIFTYFLYSITAAVSFGLVIIIIGMMVSYFGRR
jgi:hypothetical protein